MTGRRGRPMPERTEGIAEGWMLDPAATLGPESDAARWQREASLIEHPSSGSTGPDDHGA